MNKKEDKRIYKVCTPCGVSANVLTCLKRYGNRPSKLCFTISTTHKAQCDVCRQVAMVTEPRDYFYPDFSLLDRTFVYINKEKAPLPLNTEEE